MPTRTESLGWIGTGRMGYAMAERLAKGGCDIAVWNRTKEKAQPLEKYGAKVVNQLEELATKDILFVMVSTLDDVKEVIGKALASGSKGGKPKMVVECSSISLDGSAELRQMLKAKGVEYLAAPVSGNAKVIKAGKLTFVVSGPKSAYEKAKPYLDMMGVGSSYVGEGELARIAKICHNVMLGVVIQNLCEITVLAEKAGMPRHAFLDFLNKSVMGSMFTRYKTPALVNLDFQAVGYKAHHAGRLNPRDLLQLRPLLGQRDEEDVAPDVGAHHLHDLRLGHAFHARDFDVIARLHPKAPRALAIVVKPAGAQSRRAQYPGRNDGPFQPVCSFFGKSATAGWDTLLPAQKRRFLIHVQVDQARVVNLLARRLLVVSPSAGRVQLFLQDGAA